MWIYVAPYVSPVSARLKKRRQPVGPLATQLTNAFERPLRELSLLAIEDMKIRLQLRHRVDVKANSLSKLQSRIIDVGHYPVLIAIKPGGDSLEDALEERSLGLDVLVNRLFRDADLFRDLVDRGVLVALPHKQQNSGID